MATIFLEPGGDSDFGIGLWPTKGPGTAPAVATDFVHGGHIKSIKYAAGAASYLLGSGYIADAGGRFSVWIYLHVLPNASVHSAPIFQIEQTGDGNPVAGVCLTSTGGLQICQGNSVIQIGSNGSTLSIGTWYRLSFCWKITSTTVNEFRLFKNGTIDISVTNGTLDQVTSADLQVGNGNSDLALDFRSSDHYVDNSNALTDPGTVWVTAKRPYANGTTNGFTTQIGSGGSGYPASGGGHAPQVNERPQSDTNGWSMVGAGSAITEEYSIESISQGDINITGATIVDFEGWVRAKSLSSETASIIVAGSSSNISLTSTTKYFIKIAGSTTYPAGNTDIGIITTTALTTVSLYEAGVVVAYIPAVASTRRSSTYMMLGM